MNLKQHLPKVSELMHDYDILKQKFMQKKNADQLLFKGNEDTLDNL